MGMYVCMYVCVYICMNYEECAVSLDGAKLESLELKKMLRRMAVESTFADVFQVCVYSYDEMFCALIDRVCMYVCIGLRSAHC